MKKLVLLFFALAFYTTIFSQAEATTPQSRFSFGLSLEAGYSGVSNTTDDFYPNELGDYNHITIQGRRPGYAGGVWGAYQLNNRWLLQLGVNYGQWHAFGSTIGESFNTEDILVNYSRERFMLRQNLLRIPLEGRFFFGKSTDRVRPFLQLGVQASYLTKQTNFVNSLYGGIGQETYEHTYASEPDLNSEWRDIRRWQWSLIGGFGIQMDRISLSIQRNWGFGDSAYGGDDIYRWYPDYCGFGNYVDAIFPVCEDGIRQLQQTSLRFSYQLF